MLHRCCLKRFSVDNNLRLTEDKNYLAIQSPLEKDKHKTSGSRTSANLLLNPLDYWGESMLAHYTNCHINENKSSIAAQDVYTIRYAHTTQFKDKDFEENRGYGNRRDKATWQVAGWTKIRQTGFQRDLTRVHF
jgi:hypothetical protein